MPAIRHAIMMLLMSALFSGCALFEPSDNPLFNTLNKEKKERWMPSDKTMVRDAIDQINANLPYEYRVYWSPSQSLFVYGAQDGTVSLFDLQALDIDHAAVHQALDTSNRVAAYGWVRIKHEDGLPAARKIGRFGEPTLVDTLIIHTQQDSSAVIVKRSLKILKRLLAPEPATKTAPAP